MAELIQPELAHRIVWEAEAVHGAYPGRFRLVRTGGGMVAWKGSVPVEGREFPVRVTYPLAYPGLPPRLETSLPLPPHCPHVLFRRDERTELCWIAPEAVERRRRWDPQRHTAATVLRAAQRWGLALLVWQTLGLWPVPDAWEV